jgi:hypothetical protein
MKPVLILTILLFAFVLSRFPAAAQEHVDVPLPPYDPPPAVSHHSESHLEQPPRVSRQAHTKPQASTRSQAKPKASPRPKAKPKAKKSSSTHHKKQSKSKKKSKSKSHHRHGFFHWPWQHN